MTVDQWTDFWFENIGVNVIPADSSNKIPLVKWTEYQNKTISEEQYKKWKISGSFNKGVAIILGRIWRGKYEGKYLAGIDIDNKKGIEEFISCFEQFDTLEKLGQRTIVEQHNDAKDEKAHIYFIVEKPLSKRSGIVLSLTQNHSVIPAIEVKSEGKHGTMIVVPSIHKNGYPYKIIGTTKPAILNIKQISLLETTINNIYQKYNSNYKENNKIPIQELCQEDYVVYKGNNRHVNVLRMMESLFSRNKDILSPYQIKKIAYDWNQKHCIPPLDDNELELQWEDAVKFIEKNNKVNTIEHEQRENENSTKDILDLIRGRYIEIFKDQVNKSYVTVRINNHVECIPLDSNRFKKIIKKEYFDQEKKVLSEDKLEGLFGIIESEAEFNDDIRKISLSLRVARAKKVTDSTNHVFYYDLTNSRWEIVKITSQGWEIIKNNEKPLFKRYENNSSPQTYPIKNYDDKIFQRFISLFNVGSKNDRLLLMVYIISLFIPEISKTILISTGNGGGAKTTTFNLIKKIIDPSSVDTFSFPKDNNDLIQTLEHHYVNFFDNVSYISEAVSDLLCRVVSGAGFSKRMLYTDDDDKIYKIKRCIGINGINLATTRSDFLDRVITIKQNRIEKSARRKEADIYEEFEKMLPSILGYIFDTIVKVLKYKEEHKNEQILNVYPRMAEFAEWGEIIARCIGYNDNEFIEAYQENIDNQNDEVIESSPVAEAILLFMAEKKEWQGTPTELHKQLTDIIDQIKPELKRSKMWPTISSKLTSEINKVSPNLKEKNIEVETGKKYEGKRVIRLKNISQITSRDNKRKEQEIFNPFIHRLEQSDTFECEKCSRKGDIHFMKQHHCTII